MEALLVALQILVVVFALILAFASLMVVRSLGKGAVRRELEGLYDSFLRGSQGIPRDMEFRDSVWNAEWRKIVEERRQNEEFGRCVWNPMKRKRKFDEETQR